MPPAITLCDAHRPNTVQQQTTGTAADDIETQDEYFYRIVEDFVNFNTSGYSEQEIDSHISRIYTTGYLETVGLERLGAFSKSIDDFIFHCSFELAPQSGSKNQVMCADYIEVTATSSPGYPCCYVLHIPRAKALQLYRETGKLVMGYKFVVHTGSFNESLALDWADNDQILNDRNGVLFAIHNANRMTSILNWKQLAPGLAHKIDVTSSIRARLADDSDESCVTPSDELYYDIYSGQRLEYSEVGLLSTKQLCIIPVG